MTDNDTVYPEKDKRLPSIAQMRVRANDGHGKVLTRIAEGRVPIPQSASMSEYRGLRTAMKTLCRWECIAQGDEGYEVTPRGAELLLHVMFDTLARQRALNAG